MGTVELIKEEARKLNADNVTYQGRAIIMTQEQLNDVYSYDPAGQVYKPAGQVYRMFGMPVYVAPAPAPNVIDIRDKLPLEPKRGSIVIDSSSGMVWQRHENWVNLVTLSATGVARTLSWQELNRSRGPLKVVWEP